MWRGGRRAAGERGGPEGEGEHAAELNTFQGCKPSFPQRKSVVMQRGEFCVCRPYYGTPRTLDHRERGLGPPVTHRNVALSLTGNSIHTER